MGFLAQDVLPLFPELVAIDGEQDYMGINYAGFGVIAIKAIQEQQTIIETQQSLLESQKQAIEQLKARLDRLEQIIINQ